MRRRWRRSGRTSRKNRKWRRSCGHIRRRRSRFPSRSWGMFTFFTMALMFFPTVPLVLLPRLLPFFPFFHLFLLQNFVIQLLAKFVFAKIVVSSFKNKFLPVLVDVIEPTELLRRELIEEHRHQGLIEFFFNSLVRLRSQVTEMGPLKSGQDTHTYKNKCQTGRIKEGNK